MNEKFIQELLQQGNIYAVTRKLEERRAEILRRIEENTADVDELKAMLGELFDINIALGEHEDGRNES